MAANEYYNTSGAGHQGIDYNAPLPPVPPSVPSKTSDPAPAGTPGSPFSTPFDDNAYPVQEYQSHYGHNADYYSLDGAASHGPNPPTDYIPLETHPPAGAAGDVHGKARPPYAPGLGGAMDDGDAEGRRRKKRRSRFLDKQGRTPWFVYTMTLIQVAVFLAEIGRNGVLTKSPIMIRPQFNPMIGPSTYVLINMGARFVPCMRTTPDIQNSTLEINWPCPNSTSSDANHPTMQCSLSQLCGFSGVPNPEPGKPYDAQGRPNQWFRFIIPIFLHAGLIHIAFNMLLQLTLGRDMEKSIGPLRLALVYFSSGIFGFVMGGNFAAPGDASTGASGCLFGVLALILLELLYGWKERRSPGKDLAFIILDIVIAFILGLLPGLDNFAHIGGFLMGLVLGVCILHSPNALRQRIGQSATPYAPVASSSRAAVMSFIRQPLGFFKGRKAFWWVWWLFRATALFGVLAAFIVLLNSFYKRPEDRPNCTWCKYLSCLPISNWCDIGNLQTTRTNTTTTSPSKRGLF